LPLLARGADVYWWMIKEMAPETRVS